jgi:phytoene synthase
VAGTAGLACLSIWGLRAGTDRAKAGRLAVHRGQAFQRTNILRDFAQDFDEQPPRVYVPTEFWTRHGVTPADVRGWTKPESCAELLREQIALTRAHYAASDGLEEMIDPTCAPTLWAMTRIYSGLLDRIDSDPRRIVSSSRVRLPSVQKASIALNAAIKARLGRW